MTALSRKRSTPTPPHVLLICTGFFDDGPGRVVMKLLSEAEREQVRYSYLALSEDGRWRDQIESEIARLGGQVHCYNGSWKRLWSLSKEVSESGLLDDVDLIHAHLLRPDYLGRLLSRKTGTPLLVTEHGTHALKEGGSIPSLILPWFHGRVLPQKMTFAAVSSKTAFDLRGIGVPEDRIRVVLNRIDQRRIVIKTEEATEAARNQLDIAADTDLVLATVGGLVPRKATEVAITALRELISQQRVKQPVLLIFGEGPLKEDLRLYAEKEGVVLYIQFLGHREDATSLLPAADVFVHPSRDESFGLSVLEALAAGIPVTVRAGAVPVDDFGKCEMVSLVSGDSSGAWADAIMRAMKSKKHPLRLDSEGSLFADYAHLYDEILEG